MKTYVLSNFLRFFYYSDMSSNLISYNMSDGVTCSEISNDQTPS